MKFGRIVLQVNRVIFLIWHGRHDVISHRKVLPPDECTHSVYATASASSCSIVHWYLLVNVVFHWSELIKLFVTNAMFVLFLERSETILY